MSRFFVPLAAVSALLGPAPALADVLPDMVRGELLPGWRTESGAHIAALRLTLAPGWKTYWRSPGDGGIPPQFDWQGSSNIEGFSVAWPVPDVFEQNGMRSVGYEDVVTIPIEFRPAEAGAEITLDGAVEIGVCEEVCVPMTLAIRASLPADQTRPDPAISAALDDRPMTRAEAGVGTVSCAFAAISDGLRLEAEIDMPPLGADESAVVELGGTPVWVSEPMTARHGGTLKAVADLVPPEAQPFAVDRSDIRITILSEGRAVDIRGCQS